MPAIVIYVQVDLRAHCLISVYNALQDPDMKPITSFNDLWSC